MTTEAPQQPETVLDAVSRGDRPVLEQVIGMNLDSLERSHLDPSTYFLVRIAALVAMDAAPMSYLANLALAKDAGVTLEQAQETIAAIAPMVGSARVVSAAGNILRAFGLADIIEGDGQRT